MLIEVGNNFDIKKKVLSLAPENIIHSGRWHDKQTLFIKWRSLKALYLPLEGFFICGYKPVREIQYLAKTEIT